MNELKKINLVNPISFGSWQEYYTAKNKIKDWLCQHYLVNSDDERENDELTQLCIRIKNFENDKIRRK